MRQDDQHNGPGGLSLENEELPGAIRQILDLIAEQDLILGTGHLSTPEILKLIRAARQQGVRKILITHPEAPFVDMPISVQQELAGLACRFERTWVFTTPALGEVLTADQLTHAIHEVGVESTVLASDMGQVASQNRTHFPKANDSPAQIFHLEVDCNVGGLSVVRSVRRMEAAPTLCQP